MISVLEPGQKLGSFEILRRLRTGGMAHLYLARRVGVSGFERPVAIKVVLPHLAQDETFNRMFVDEALLSARIDHPNVVRVEELGRFEDTHFLVMEYVHGCALVRLWEDLCGLGRRMQPRLAVWIAIQVLDGLHAAHETRGPDGKLLGVVHRDVSPQNILLAYRGHVKLIDFGIAKARGRLAETDHGVVRGKLKYMSPEQTRAAALDARSDVYSLGIVLWELLTGERYFGDTGDLDVLARIRSPKPRRPGELVSGLPAALDDAVLAALAPRREDRPRTAMDLRRRLAEAMPHAMTVDAEQLANLLQEVMGDEITRQAQLVPEPARRAVTGIDPTLVDSRELAGVLDSLTVTIPPPPVLDAPRPPPSGRTLIEESDATDLGAQGSSVASAPASGAPAEAEPVMEDARPAPGARSSRRKGIALAIAVAAALVLGGAAVVTALSGGSAAEPDRVEAHGQERAPAPSPRPTPAHSVEGVAPEPAAGSAERPAGEAHASDGPVEGRGAEPPAPAGRGAVVRRGAAEHPRSEPAAGGEPAAAGGGRAEPSSEAPPPPAGEGETAGYRLVDGVPIVDDIR